MSLASLSPIQRYERDLQKDGFMEDPAQRMAVEKLQSLYDALIEDEKQRAKKTYRFFGKFKKKNIEPVKGLYFWGGVGRGKTYLMDNFYESLPFDRKMRIHFHRFMQRVHAELTTLNDTPDPLLVVADRLADETRIICFDEFFVSDIGDAMILAGLMEALFARGVSLVCTSNIVPDGLYKDGLQRARFLPAIALVNKHTEVVNVDGGTDYRLRTLQQAELFHHPLDAQADINLEKYFSQLAVEAGEHGLLLTINGRPLNALRHADDVVWFDFKELCDGPRSQNDYIELAREFHAVILSDVPTMGSENDDQARRFINLIDEFYDRNVKLIISAAAPIHALYEGGRLSFEFERTESRLLEMQSEEYLASEHRA
ncbi:ATPase [Oleiphilus sp. HI0009]|nr:MULTISPECIES: cell division protein ZapE [unclassified Oleiphilus]KZX82619.1 ATPase [Oleiphilus sp. HI0009]KZY65467.1 ATPase [Oleiphilus sp. HI0066]KZY69192.1 ATPase [Oleiphilus sp. HI0067]